jgi:hypothetical protein
MASLPVWYKMDITRENQIFYVFTRQLGDKLKKMHNDLFVVYADIAVHSASVSDQSNA